MKKELVQGMVLIRSVIKPDNHNGRIMLASIVTPVIVAMKTTLSSSNSCIIWPRDYRYLVRRVK